MKKIYCSSNEQETRFAVTENNVLEELMIESVNDVLGNIYLGRVEIIQKESGYAFVQIGLEKNAFLQEKGIDKLTQGQYLLVQVKKEDTNGKGVRVTMNIEFSGKYLVYMPYDNTVAVSKKIKNSNWRELGKKWCESTEGIIFRSSCEGVQEEIVEEEFKQYKKIYSRLLQLKNKPTLAYEKESKFVKYIQDCSDVLSVEVDNFELVNQFREYLPKELVKHYREKENIFSKYLLDIEIQKLLQKRVELKNGAFLLFEQVETMTIIDVNSGSFKGKNDKETTAFEINKLACSEIISQLKLRNIGGMVCIDFINMNKTSNKKAIQQMIIKESKRDNVKYNIYEFTKLGLLEMTRERTGKTLKEIMNIECTYCNGTGEVILAKEQMS